MEQNKLGFIVYQDEEKYREKAMRLSDHFSVACYTASGIELTDEKPYLVVDEKGLGLFAEGQLFYGDFSRLLSRVGSHLQHEVIARVAKMEKKKEDTGEEKEKPIQRLAIDATAGMGEDSFILAAMGYEVVMIEHNPVIAELLKDALERGRKQEDLKEILGRMTLVEGESTKLLSHLNQVPDVIYLDPMFPEKKKTGLSKKKLQLLQQLEDPCSEEEELLQAALATGTPKVIVKRPPQGPFLAEQRPSYSLTRKAVRFDCYVQ